MVVVTFLTYQDFLEEITQTVLDGPVRVQDYTQTKLDRNMAPLAHCTTCIDVAAETPEGVLLCRFKIGYTQTLGDHDEARLGQLRRAETRARRLAGCLRANLVDNGLATGKGLIALNEGDQIDSFCAWPAWFAEVQAEAGATE